MFDSIPHLVARYGYVVVALLVGAEGVGVPVPGETALITAAVFAARGHLLLPWVIAASVIGVAAGGSGGYWIGRTAGQAVVTRYGRWIGITPENLEYARAFFAHHGAKAVVIGRFLPIIRILTGIVAGITNMPFARFAAFNALAGLLWSVAFGVLGYEFGRNIFRFEDRIGRIGLVVVLLAIVSGFIFLKWRAARAKRRGLVKP
jgi:membrane protein DedA with SNARE-associated domain